MARRRTTLDVSQAVATANRMILHLSQSGTREDQIKREAIIAVTSQMLLDGNAYRGFRYLNPPTPTMPPVYDDTRIAFNG